MARTKKTTAANLGFEDKLWVADDRWRFHKDAVDAWVKHGLGATPRNSGYDAQCGEERK